MDNEYNTLCVVVLIVIAVIVLLCPILNALRPNSYNRRQEPELVEGGLFDYFKRHKSDRQKCDEHTVAACLKSCLALGKQDGRTLNKDEKNFCTYKCYDRNINNCLNSIVTTYNSGTGDRDIYIPPMNPPVTHTDFYPKSYLP